MELTTTPSIGISSNTWPGSIMGNRVRKVGVGIDVSTAFSGCTGNACTQYGVVVKDNDIAEVNTAISLFSTPYVNSDISRNSIAKVVTTAIANANSSGAQGVLGSGTYASGGAIVGSALDTCTLSNFNGAGTGATATVALTGPNVIAGGTAIVVTAPGSDYSFTPTQASLGNGTATCSGTALLNVVLTSVQKTSSLIDNNFALGGFTGAAPLSYSFGTDPGATFNACDISNGHRNCYSPFGQTSFDPGLTATKKIQSPALYAYDPTATPGTDILTHGTFDSCTPWSTSATGTTATSVCNVGTPGNWTYADSTGDGIGRIAQPFASLAAPPISGAIYRIDYTLASTSFTGIPFAFVCCGWAFLSGDPNPQLDTLHPGAHSTWIASTSSTTGFEIHINSNSGQTGSLSFNNFSVSSVTGGSGFTAGPWTLTGTLTSLMPDARIYNSTAESIQDATPTLLSFDTVRWDTNGMYSGGAPTCLTAPISGYYAIEGQVEWGPNATGQRYTYIQIGADQIAQSPGIAADPAQTTEQAAVTEWYVPATTCVEVGVYQTSGAPLNVNATPKFSPEFIMRFLRP
jgi:hypothetical protein